VLAKFTRPPPFSGLSVLNPVFVARPRGHKRLRRYGAVTAEITMGSEDGDSKSWRTQLGNPPRVA
jgi:hypothetical protein